MPRPAKRPRSSKSLPRFRNEAAERTFWQRHDSSAYLDWTKARPARFPNLQPSTATISLRLPQGMLDDLKVLARKQDVPYQSLLKIYLADRLTAESRRMRRRTGA